MAPVSPLPLAGGGDDPLPSRDPYDRPDRNLLIRGNAKLGEDVLHFDLPARSTCPGRSDNCSGMVKLSPKARGSRRCYSLQLYSAVPLAEGSAPAQPAGHKAPGEVHLRMTFEIQRRHASTVRPHVSGDFHTEAYARAWLEIMRATPDTE